jgi:hypothetical protein
MCLERQNLEHLAKSATSLSRRFPNDDKLRMNAVDTGTAVTLHLMSCLACQESQAQKKAS